MDVEQLTEPILEAMGMLEQTNKIAQQWCEYHASPEKLGWWLTVSQGMGFPEESSPQRW